MKKILFIVLSIFVLSLPALSLAHGLETEGMEDHHDGDVGSMMDMMGSGGMDSMMDMMSSHHRFSSMMMESGQLGFWLWIIRLNLLAWLLAGLLFIAFLMKRLTKK
ncbi:MAG: hypothetical protein Q8P45_00705 [Candidatus Harrisonbacteria bacterium]|nr:hypothetical protein [Candidatus Harrisonbacteria bacterium]